MKINYKMRYGQEGLFLDLYHKDDKLGRVNLPKENRWYDAKLYNSSGEQYFNQTFKKD